MNPDSYDIQSHNILSDYQRRPKYLVLHTLHDYSKCKYTSRRPISDPHELENKDSQGVVILELSDGIFINKNITKNT